MEPNYGVPTGGVPLTSDIADLLRAKIERRFVITKTAPPVGTKYDTLKPRWSLIPKGTLAQVVAVLTFGAAKYSSDNWMYVEPEKYYNALHRHVDAWRNGEKLDEESGMHHLAHALCCLLFMLWHDDNKQGSANG